MSKSKISKFHLPLLVSAAILTCRMDAYASSASDDGLGAPAASSSSSSSSLSTTDSKFESTFKFEFLDGGTGTDAFDSLFKKVKKQKAIITASAKALAFTGMKADPISPKRVVFKDCYIFLHAPIWGEVAGEEYGVDSKTRAYQIAVTSKFVSAYYEEKRQALGHLSSLDTFILSLERDGTITILDDIMLGACKIRSVIQARGEAPIMFLGRSPGLVKLAYECLMAAVEPGKNLSGHVLYQNFSGAPDMTNLRTASGFNDTEAQLARNLVTPDKLAFMCRYMDEIVGLGKVVDKLYVVDVIGNGASLNSYLRLLRYFFEQHKKRPMPAVHFLNLSHPYDMTNEKLQETALYRIEKKGMDSALTFLSNEEIGSRSLTIPMSLISLVYTTGTFLDEDLYQRHLSKGVYFPAQNWRKEWIPHIEKGGVHSSDFHKEVGVIMATKFEKWEKIGMPK